MNVQGRNDGRTGAVCTIFLLLMLIVAASPLRAQQLDTPLSLLQAVSVAQANDPWLVKNSLSQQAIESMSVAAGSMPDPRVTVALANLPTDTFDFSQEAMTQFKVGISQMIPRGDSLSLKKKQLEELAEQFPFQREDRKAKLTLEVAKLWLQSFQAQESIKLIETDRPLFEQLSDVAEASYSTALGKTRQQDIIRAQLELTRLDDRLTVLQQMRDSVMERLGNSLSGNFREQYLEDLHTGSSTERWSRRSVSPSLPIVTMLKPDLYTSPVGIDPQLLYGFFVHHPSVQGIERRIEANSTGVELARQKYKSSFGVNTSYSYRDEAPNGNDRADLVTLGLSFDLPWFTANRQDKEVGAARAKSEAVKTEKWFVLRKMIADFEKSRVELQRLNERQALYQQTLLPQLHEQAEASLTAYTNDDGDFAEVVRARIAELNGRLAALKIDVERQKVITQLNYYFMESPDDIVTENTVAGEKK